MKKSKKLPRLFGVYATLGCAFLVFPTVSLYDVMPDIVGWILMYLAVSELAFFSEDLAGLKKITVYLCALSAARMALGVIMIGKLNSQAMNDTNAFMTAATLFAVCEIICVILYVKYFFAGMEHISTRNGGTTSIDAISNARFLTGAFLISRSVLTLIPELFPLAQTQAYIDIDNSAMWENVYNLRMPMMLLCMIVSLSFGLYFLFGFRKMFIAVRKDEALINELSQRYSSEVTRDSNRIKADRIRSGLFLVAIGLFFFINFVIDFNYLVPKFVGIALIYAGAMRMRHYGDFRRTVTCCFAAFPVLIATYLFRFTTSDSFFREISLYAAYMDMSNADKILHAVCGALESGAVAVLVSLLYGDICSAASLAAEKDLTHNGIAPKVAAYMYVAINLALYAFPPSRQVLVEADALVTAAWLLLSLRLFSRINDEMSYRYLYS